jgi:hypothetical protein
MGLPSDHATFPVVKLDWDRLTHDMDDLQERMDSKASANSTSIDTFLSSLPTDVNPTARALVEQILINSKYKKLPEHALLVLLSLVSQLSKE